MAEEALRRVLQERLEKAERFLRTAQRALRDGDYESAVSRAYYAVFHSIHALLNEPETRENHPEVIRRCVQSNRTYTQLNTAGNLEGREDLNGSLRGLHRWRNEADYQLGMTNRHRAQIALEWARHIVGVIKEVVS